MKNFKRIYSFLLCLVMLLTNITPVYATETTTYPYEVHYFFDNTEDVDKVETGNDMENAIINAKDYSSDTYELDSSLTPNTSLTISATEANILNVHYKTKIKNANVTLNFVDANNTSIGTYELENVPTGVDIKDYIYTINYEGINNVLGDYTIGYYTHNDNGKREVHNALPDDFSYVVKDGSNSVNIPAILKTSKILVIFTYDWEWQEGYVSNDNAYAHLEVDYGTTIPSFPTYPGASELNTTFEDFAAGSDIYYEYVENEMYDDEWTTKGYKICYINMNNKPYYFSPSDEFDVKVVDSFIANTETDHAITIKYAIPSSYTIHHMLGDGEGNYTENEDLMKTIGMWDATSVIPNDEKRGNVETIENYLVNEAKTYPLSDDESYYIKANKDDNNFYIYYEPTNVPKSVKVNVFLDNLLSDTLSYTTEKIYEIGASFYPEDISIDSHCVVYGNYYTFDGVTYQYVNNDLPLTINSSSEENVVNLYFERIPDGQYLYEIHYFYNDVEDRVIQGIAAKDELIESDYTNYYNPSFIILDTDKTTSTSMTISDVEENVLNIYVKLVTYDYEIHYFFDDVEDVDKLETGSMVEGDMIQGIDYSDNNYVLDMEKTPNIELIISADNENILNMYFKTKEYPYTINYYFENVLDTKKSVTKMAKVDEIIDAIDYSDAFFEIDTENTLSSTLTISSIERNVLDVYYKLKNYPYEIHYYFDDVENMEKLETGTKHFQELVDAKDYSSDIYELDEEKTPKTHFVITNNNSLNIWKVYYKTKEPTKYDYEVHYFFDDKEDTSKLEKGSLVEGTVVSAKDYKGDAYELDTTKTPSTTLTISAATKNVLNIYYKTKVVEPTTATLTINIYKDGKLIETKTDTKEIGSKIDSVSNYYSLGNNKELEKIESLPLTIDKDSNKNVINIYIKTKTSTLTVRFFLDGNLIEAQTATKNVGEEILDVNEYFTIKSSQKLDKIETLPLTISADASKNIVNVYASTRERIFTIKIYLDDKLQETKEINKKIGEQITDIKGYYSTPSNSTLKEIKNLPLVINEDISKNVVEVFFITKVVEKGTITYKYFYDGIEDTSKEETMTYTAGKKITNSPSKSKTGYEFYKHENLPCVIKANENIVVKVFYTKISCPVYLYYYVNGILAKTQKYGDYNVGDKINNITAPTIEGAKLTKIDSVPYTVKVGKNIINLYYDKVATPEKEEKGNGKIEYRYYFDNKEDTSLKEYKTYREGTKVDSYKDKVKEGYAFEKVIGTPVTIEKNKTHTISVYYKSVKETPSIKMAPVYVHVFVDGEEIDNYELGTYEIGMKISDKDVNLDAYNEYDFVESNLPIEVEENKNDINIYLKEKAPVEEPTPTPSEEEPTPGPTEEPTPSEEPEEKPTTPPTEEPTPEEPKEDKNIGRTVTVVGVGVGIPLLLSLLLFFKDDIMLLLIPTDKKRKEYLYGIWTSFEGATFQDEEGNEIIPEYDAESGKWLFFNKEGYELDITTNEEMVEMLNHKEITYQEFTDFLATNGYTTIIDAAYKMQMNVNETIFEETELTQGNITTTLELYHENEDLTTIDINCYIKEDAITKITFTFGE